MVGFTSADVTSSMGDSWKRFADGAFDSFKTFTKSAFTDFKSFGNSLKDLAKDIVADLIATFASNALKNVLSKVFGGGGSSGGGSLISSIGSLISGGKGAAAATSGGASGAVPSAAGLPSFGTIAATIGKGATAIGQGAAAAGQAISGAASAVLNFIPGWGQAILAVAAIAAAVGSGARTPQELAEDQLRAVDEATRLGRNLQVTLSAVGDTAVSFLGGFDENSVFFGVDLLKDQLQQVGTVLTEQFGFNQALALRDGVIRLEDFSRDFSTNSGQIINEVRQAIAQVTGVQQELSNQSLGGLSVPGLTTPSGAAGQINSTSQGAQVVSISPQLEATLLSLTEAMQDGNSNAEFERAANAGR